MSFLKRAIRDGIRKGVGDAIGKAVQQAVEPTATRLANQAADSFEQLTGQMQQAQPSRRQSSDLESALGSLQRSMEDYATETAKNVKICPSCKEPTTAEKKFCPSCGAKLPELTVAQGAVCSACGKQNAVGTKFCSDCGAKLPAVLAEEAEEVARGEAIMARWEESLGAYPRWSCGGIPVDIERMDTDAYTFTVDFKGDAYAARQGIRDYLSLARQHGFRPAGQYPSNDILYRKVGGVCCCITTEHSFDGDPDCPVIYFCVREPAGGFDYVKPEPRKKVTLMDLFK